MFYCGHVRLGFAQGPLHSSRHFLGRAGWWWRMGWPINQPVGIYGEIIAFLFPSPPSKTGWRAGGKKAASHMEGSYLDWALADLATSRPTSCMTGHSVSCSSVDNRTLKRLLYQVLDHDPGHKDIEAFLRRFEKALRQRGLVLQGVTTDGSPLYPEPLQAVFGDVPHPICEFHILKELTKVTRLGRLLGKMS